MTTEPRGVQDRARARRILDSYRYMSPEEVTWAIGVLPEYAVEVDNLHPSQGFFGPTPPEPRPMPVVSFIDLDDK